jgi:signal transduction histidine kinase
MAEGSNPLDKGPRPPLSKRVTPSQWEAVDAVLAVTFAGLTVPFLAGLDHNFSRNLPLWPMVLLSLAATLPLALRRRHPIGVLAIVTVALTVATGFGVAFGPNPTIALAVYTVATQCDRRRSFSALVTAEVALVGALVVAELTTTIKGDLTFSPVVAAAAWFVGDSVRARRAYTAGLAEQAAQRQREEVERARRSVVEERVRIARELHDVVAHSLSVISIQAGAGRHVLDSDPAETRRALASVETTSRSALGELRRVVGLLRQADQLSPALAPAPGLDDLGRLVEQVSAAGVPVDLDLGGEPISLPQGVELSVYRIVQEALTNVVKHAGPARARVAISVALDAVDVEILDDGSGLEISVSDGNGARSDDQPQHHGIIGMRERVALYGGSLTVGGGPNGGFRVAAHLPLVDRP